MGHRSFVITPEPNPASMHGVTLLNPNRLLHVIRAVRACDGLIIHQDSLGIAWPVLFAKKSPLLVAHVHFQKRKGLAWLFSKLLFKSSRVCAVSRALSIDTTNDFSVHCDVVPNPYDDSVFAPPKIEERNVDFCFTGRLAIHKRCDIFIHALGLLKEAGADFRALVIGDGPERRIIEDLLTRYELQNAVAMVGDASPQTVAASLQRSRCVVIPSGYEPFGVVALEARASGCRVIASNVGGLPEAAGPLALLVKPLDVEDLARALRMILQETTEGKCQDPSLLEHRPRSVAEVYLDLLSHKVPQSPKI